MLEKTLNKYNNLLIVENPMTNEKYIEIEMLDTLWKLYSDFFSTKKNLESSRKDFFDKCILFFDWYISYVENIIPKNNEYSSKEICDNIFTSDLKNDSQKEDYLKSHLFISKQYVEYLKSNIKLHNIHKYKHNLINLKTDLKEIITYWEFFSSKDTSKISLMGGRNHYLSVSDIYSSIEELFFIEESDRIEDLYLRDLKPVVMFQIRQLLEIYGKNLIGYDLILDKNGTPIKKFTQIAWRFIEKEVKNKNSRIEIPFDIDVIISLNKWTNTFVHTTYLDNDYIQFFAINCIRDLFKQDEKGVFYDNRWHSNINYGAVKINNYESLKNDFEKYLNKKYSNTNFQIIWKELKDVGAHIIS
ncbi:hypothetical protein [Capnocytophaga leadbetteri]